MASNFREKKKKKNIGRPLRKALQCQWPAAPAPAFPDQLRAAAPAIRQAAVCEIGKGQSGSFHFARTSRDINGSFEGAGPNAASIRLGAVR